MPDEISANKRRALKLVVATTLPVVLVALVVGLAVGNLVVGVILAVVWAVFWVTYARTGDGAARQALGGRPADPVADARLHNLVDGLCGGAGVPKPALVVLDDPAPNALAFGPDPRHATLAVTTGLLGLLGRVELEGVLARELATIKRHETAPATVAVALLRVLGPIGPVASWVRHTATATPAAVVDASGVAITRYPPGLVAALEKLRAAGAGVQVGSPATAHLWVVPPDPSLHPPLEERIAALREL
ncbi:MAG: Zn-dependent protease with chaperone function [Actinomycetia bacterium]|nr:Zn-dependent protease with chaperone function [Actinomycetes bacterium]